MRASTRATWRSSAPANASARAIAHRWPAWVTRTTRTWTLLLEQRSSRSCGAELMTVAQDYAPVLLTHPGRTTPVSLQEYEAEDGYAGWRKALTEMAPDQVVEEVKASG